MSTQVLKYKKAWICGGSVQYHLLPDIFDYMKNPTIIYEGLLSDSVVIFVQSVWNYLDLFHHKNLVVDLII